MAIQVFSRKILTSVEEWVGQGKTDKQVRGLLLSINSDLSDRDVERLCRQARAKPLTESYGRDPRLLQKVGLGFKSFLKRSV